MFDTLDKGFITKREPAGPAPVAAGSRCAVAANGELVCTYSVQSALGVNDFVPTVARSTDDGRTWTEEGPIWPGLADRFSINGNVSRAPSGELFIYGIQIPIDVPGESFWSQETNGMKQNDIFWAKSTDNGRTWSEPAVILKPTPGSAEAPGAMCVTRTGRWLACYAPYRTFDPAVVVDRRQIVVMGGDDQERTWSGQPMLRFAEQHSSGAEAWVIELADGRLLGTCWHINEGDGGDYPNAYALSTDGGDSWGPTRSTDILGQSTGLAALPDGRALFIYNQRKHGEPGVRLAVIDPTEEDFGVEADELIWRAEVPTQTGTSSEHTEWQDFAFGEPSVSVLPGGELLATLWCIQPSGQGIRFVRLRLRDA